MPPSSHLSIRGYCRILGFTLIRTLRWSALTFVLTIAGHPRALALDAKGVYDTASPSTVCVADVEDYTTGIVLNEKGLILTSYYRVAANVSLKVRAAIKIGGRVVVADLDQVKLLKVHKAYDLALLQAEPPPNGTFIPARLLPPQSSVSSGAKCFVLGNATGLEGQSLDADITAGLVSAAQRNLDGLDYIQVSAAINEGNEFGPVCDDQGRVIGIAAGNLKDSEGAGFAMPVSQLAAANFIDLKDRKNDDRLLAQAVVTGESLSSQIWQAPVEAQGTVAKSCIEAFRYAMAGSNPARSGYYATVSKIYRNLKKPDAAMKYAQAGVRIEPNSPACNSMLGLLTKETNPQDPAVLQKSIAIWFRGMQSGSPSGSNESQCASHIASAMLTLGKPVPAAYMVRWSESLSGVDLIVEGEKRDSMWAKIKQAIPAEALAALRAKSAGFTKAEFDSLVAGKMVSKQPPVASNSPASAGADAASLVKQAQMTQIAKNAAIKFAAPIPVPSEGLQCPLPDIAGNCVLAYAGWQIVIAFPDLQQLGIFNLSTGKIEGYIPCADPKPLLAAGGQVLTVYQRGSRLLEVYDLASLKKIGSKPLPPSEPIEFIGMGLLNPSRVFVLQKVELPGGRQIYRPSVFSIPDLRAVELRAEMKGEENPLWKLSPNENPISGGMDEAGNIALVGSRDGTASYTIGADQRVEFRFDERAGENPKPTLGAKYYVSQSDLFDPVSKSDPYRKVGPGRLYRLAPVAGYPAFAAVENSDVFSGLRVFGLPGMNKLVSLALKPAPDGPFLYHRTIEEQIETLLASAYCNRIAYVLPAQKMVFLFPLGLKDSGPGAGYAEPGKQFERKINIPSGSTVTIQSAPEGLAYNAHNSTLVWEVPAQTRTGQTVQVIILVQDAEGKPSYTVEKIPVP